MSGGMESSAHVPSSSTNPHRWSMVATHASSAPPTRFIAEYHRFSRPIQPRWYEKYAPRIKSAPTKEMTWRNTGRREWGIAI